MRAARVAPVMLSTATVGCAVAAGLAEASVQVHSGTSAVATVPLVLLAVAALSWALVGAVIAWHRPANTLGWLLLVTGAITQASVAAEAFARAQWPLPPASVGLTLSFLGGMLLFLSVGLLPLLYPTGRTAGRGATLAVALVIVGAVLQQVQWLWAQLEPTMTWAFGPPSDAVPVWLVWTPVALYFVGVVLGWCLCAVRLTRAPYPERQQLAWLLLSAVTLLAVMLLGDSLIAIWLQALAVPLVPAAIAIGILQYRLLAIETALPRTVTYVLLTALAAAVYLAVTAWSGIQITGAVLPAVVGAAILAVGLLPLRSRLQRLVERFLYGRATDPVHAVADLGRSVASADAGQLLAVALERVADAFRARGAAMYAADGTERARAGEVDAPALSVDLRVAGTLVGRLGLAPRRRGEPYSRRDGELLSAIGAQVALVVRAVDLAALIQDQRDTVVAATANERDRLRGDLHDGLGPSLTGMGLGLRGVDDALQAGDVARAQTLTKVLADEMARAVVEVRRVLDGLGPGDLVRDDLGAALRQRLGGTPSSIPVRVEVGDLPQLTPDEEGAVYRILSEAVANALRHSGADDIVVEIGLHDDALVARVADDGSGLGADAGEGIGIASMHRRARSLGGEIDVDTSAAGTTVTLRVPVVAAR